MALYFSDNTKLKINLNGEIRCLNIGTPLPAVSKNIKLLSSDNYILKDINGLFLIPKEAK